MQKTGAPRILVAGGGYVGLYTALRLERLLDPGEADLTLVNAENFLVYRPLLPEVASGTVEPRHAVVPLRRALRRTQVLTGELVGLDHARRSARIRPSDGAAYDLGYDHVVVGLGAITRLLPIPGLAEQAVGFQTVTEAIYLRNHVLHRMEVAEASVDADARRRALTFTFVGGGYTGVEAIAELEDMVAAATPLFPTISRNELRWVLIEATGRILPTVQPELARHALQVLRARGIEVRLDTTLESAEDGMMRLSDGEEFASDTLVWAAGVRPHPLAAELGLPVDDNGRLVVDRQLRVDGVDGAWAAGDNAAVPDGQGGFFPPTAQHAQREALQIGDNLVATLRGQPLAVFRYDSIGEMITLGHRKGVATLYGRRVTGFPSWALRRLYYAWQIPTLNRKLRILIDWVIGLAFKRDVVSLGGLYEPHGPIRQAASHDDAA